MTKSPEITTTPAASINAERWMAGLAAGAAGLAGMSGIDEAYGAIVTLDNGGTGWTLDKPDYFSGTTSAATTRVDIGSPGSASFALGWYNDSYGSSAGLSGNFMGSAFKRNIASATPGTTGFGSGGVSFVRYSSGTLQNGVQTGSDNWLAVSLSDLGINAGTTTFGWMQLDLQATTLSVLAFYYSDAAGGIAHLDGAGGVTEQRVPEPGSLALLAAGAGGIAALRRRRKSAAAQR